VPEEGSKKTTPISSVYSVGSTTTIQDHLARRNLLYSSEKLMTVISSCENDQDEGSNGECNNGYEAIVGASPADVTATKSTFPRFSSRRSTHSDGSGNSTKNKNTASAIDINSPADVTATTCRSTPSDGSGNTAPTSTIEIKSHPLLEDYLQTSAIKTPKKSVSQKITQRVRNSITKLRTSEAKKGPRHQEEQVESAFSVVSPCASKSITKLRTSETKKEPRHQEEQ